MGEARIRLACEGPVATITLDRPDSRNAMSGELVARMIEAVHDLSWRDEVRAVIVTGAGTGFCAGSDLRGLAPMDGAGRSHFEAESGRLARMIGTCAKPVIAAVHGFAIGGGLTLATACDIVVTSPAAKWSLPEAPIGLFPAWGIGSVVARAGTPVARRLCWGIDTLSGTEAVACGLADELADDPLAAAKALAERLCALPPASSRAVKAWFAADAACEADDVAANDLFMRCCDTAEGRATLERFGSKA